MRTRGPGVANFFARNFRHTKGPLVGQPFVLEGWQREFTDELYEVDDDGLPFWRLIVFGVPKGSGKTPKAGGYGIYELRRRRDSPDIFVASGSREQARTCLEYARPWVEKGPLRKHISASRNFLRSHDNNGVMRVLATSGVLQHGPSPSVCIVDELHAFTKPTQEDMWEALWTALIKRPDSFMLVITTAGYDKETILGRLYDEALKLPDGEDRECLRIRRDRENRVLFWWYGISEEQKDEWADERLWRAANPASWISMEELRRELNAPGADELAFQRWHLNMWTSVRSTWMASAVWEGLKSETEIPEGAAIVIGVDAAYTYDCTAVAWAWRDPDDGRVHLRARVWSVRDEAPAHVRVAGDRLKNMSLVVPFVHELAERYTIREIAFDDQYFTAEAEELGRRYVIFPIHPASRELRDATKRFHRDAHEGRIAHDGDRVLAAHVGNVVRLQRPDGSYVLDKVKDPRPIDACQAAILAHSRAAGEDEGEAPPPQIIWVPGF